MRYIELVGLGGKSRYFNLKLFQVFVLIKQLVRQVHLTILFLLL